MPFQEHGWNKVRSGLLMDITATLSEYTQHAGQFCEIPGYLGRILKLESLSLAIVQEAKEGARVLLGATSSKEKSASFERDVLALYQQTRPLSAQDGPTLRSTTEMEPTDVTEVPVQSQAEFPRATVFTHSIDAGHRMLLVVQQRTGDAHLSGGVTEMLQAITLQLGKLLSCLVVWLARPEVLGAPFDRLTDREWMVLRGLNSDAGEKQLADQLGLSPHTLHSHIKSIYRKVGVQGRLPLLLRAQDVMRGLRIGKMNSHTVVEVRPQGERAALAM